MEVSVGPLHSEASVIKEDGRPDVLGKNCAVGLVDMARRKKGGMKLKLIQPKKIPWTFIRCYLNLYEKKPDLALHNAMSCSIFRTRIRIRIRGNGGDDFEA